MIYSAFSAPGRPSRRALAWPVPRPRRLTVVLGLLASAGVAASSLRAAPAVLLIVMAGVVKAVTIALIAWALTHPHSAIGPHGPLDWVPLGALNAATGIWLLRVIRHQAC